MGIGGGLDVGSPGGSAVLGKSHACNMYNSMCYIHTYMYIRVRLVCVCVH